MAFPVVVREYPSDRQFQDDARQAAVAGYRVVSVSHRTRSRMGAAFLWPVVIALMLSGLFFLNGLALVTLVVWFVAVALALLAVTERKYVVVATYQLGWGAW